jgi:phosphoglycolate phosphatase-like HAD superfamily hydrolase
MRRTILVDCDDVLLNWTEGFRLFFEHRHGRKLDPRGTDHWNLCNWTGLTIEESAKEVNEFNMVSWEFGGLPAVPGAVSAIKNLHSMYLCDIAVITSCSTSPQTVALRKANLFHVFGDVFSAVHCVDLGESKATHLADYYPTFWVEDNVSNAVLGLKYGHHSIVLETRQNSPLKEETQDKLSWVNSWREIEEIIAKN